MRPLTWLPALLAIAFAPESFAASWSTTTPIPGGRINHGAELLDDGSVLLVGGDGPSSTTPTDARYSPATASWTAASSGYQFREANLAHLSNDRVLLGGSYWDLARIFTPSTQAWSSTPALTKRADFPIIALANATALVIGGTRLGGYALSSTLRYDAVANSWAAGPALVTPRSSGRAHLLSDGRIVVHGGVNSVPSRTATCEILDPGGTAFRAVAPMLSARVGEGAVRLADDRILVVGGEIVSYTAVASAELFDPVTEKWSAAAPFPTTIDTPVATLLADGRVLVTGGGVTSTSVDASLNAYFYSPLTGAWSAAPDMPVKRRYHTATRLQDGRVLVAGGKDGYNYLDSVLLFDPLGSSDAGSPPDASARADAAGGLDVAAAPDGGRPADAAVNIDASAGADAGPADARSGDVMSLADRPPDVDGAPGCGCTTAGAPSVMVLGAVALACGRAVRRRVIRD